MQTLVLTRLAQNPQFVCRGDLDVPVHARQWFELAGREDGKVECWCYTDRLSYQPGETVLLHAISTTPTITVKIDSLMLNPTCLLQFKAIASWQDTPNDVSVKGCSWPQAAEFKIPYDWPSGVYKIRLQTEDLAQAEHLIVVRPTSNRDKHNRLLLITSDCTWSAYNDWGGSNHYEGIIDSESNLFSPRLSNQRPFARGFVSLPENAPRTLPEQPPKDGKIIYPHMEWAWQQGYSKKYASAGWASYERIFCHWAEEQGYCCDVATQQDLHYRPEVLDGYQCVLIVGHDEYWSWSMRDAIDNYVELGGRVARFAGNFMWQIRLENDGQTQICHKYLAHLDDPLMDTDEQRLLTTAWESKLINRPGRATFGLDALKGIYAGWGGLAAKGSGGFTLYRPEHWAFADCRLGYGDVLGGQSKIFGYEVDGLDYGIEKGLPFPEQCEGLPDNLQVLALGLARLREDNFINQSGPLFVGDEDAKYAAQVLYDDDSEEILERVNRGSGMIVHFHKGKGEVFHAGTTEWVAGLLRKEFAVEQVTRNVLNRFLA